MVQMVIYTCTSFLVCNFPVAFLMMFGIEWKALYNLFRSIYYLQFTSNFVIYAASNRMYKEAYIMFIKEGICRMRNQDQHHDVFVLEGNQK